MSTETPEVKNPYQLRREAIARAVQVWQEMADDDNDTPLGAAEALEDRLLDEGLILLPRSTGHGKWRVLVDGQPAPYVGQEQPSHPMGAEQAAELFLTATAGDYYSERQIIVRPASDEEMTVAAVTGEATVREAPVTIAATSFMAEIEENIGAVLLRLFDKEGREVQVGMGDAMREAVVSALDTEDGDR